MDNLINVASYVFEVDSSSLSLDTERKNLEKWDSLAHLSLVAEIEERFQVRIPFEDIAGIKKLRDFLRYIKVY